MVLLSILNEKGMTKYAFRMISSRLMKAIHVELPYETIDLIMPKVFRQDQLLKLIDILNDKLAS